MLSAIGSATFPSTVGTGSSAASLQSQLDRYQQQLSDCVNCSSAKTRQGQEAIQNLSNKVGEIKARIEQITASKSNTQPSAPITGVPTDIAANNGVTALGVKGSTADAAVSASGFATTNVGSILNVFA